MLIKWLLICMIVFFASCVPVKPTNLLATVCSDAQCHLVGKLEVFPGGVGSGTIRTSESCYDLALPENVLRNPKKWDQKVVAIDGEPVAHPDMPSAMWYDIKDRRVEPGGCSAATIYVKEIKVQGQD